MIEKKTKKKSVNGEEEKDEEFFGNLLSQHVACNFNAISREIIFTVSLQSLVDNCDILQQKTPLLNL